MFVVYLPVNPQGIPATPQWCKTMIDYHYCCRAGQLSHTLYFIFFVGTLVPYWVNSSSVFIESFVFVSPLFLFIVFLFVCLLYRLNSDWIKQKIFTSFLFIVTQFFGVCLVGNLHYTKTKQPGILFILLLNMYSPVPLSFLLLLRCLD